MPTQLTLDFTPTPQLSEQLTIRKEDWLDVSDLARGVGYAGKVQVSIALNEALAHHNEPDNDYDQRLYDALWLAHFRLSLDQSQSTTFNFTFHRQNGDAAKFIEVSLRLRAQTQNRIVLLGLLEDF